MFSQEDKDLPPLVESQPVTSSDKLVNQESAITADVEMENDLDYSDNIETVEIKSSSPVQSVNQIPSSSLNENRTNMNVAPASESEFEPHSEFESTVHEFERYN